MIKQLVNKLISLKKINNKPFKPIIISDIDGVLVRGHVPIPGTHEAILKIYDRKIPFACLTNGGGQLESSKVNKLNTFFKAELFNSEFMFMNHTPLKPKLIQYSEKPGNLLISGSLHVKDILQDLGIKNYITADELYAIYIAQIQTTIPIDSQYSIHARSDQFKKDYALKTVEDRLGRKMDSLKTQIMNINSIFALNDVSPYQTTLQIIHNILEVRKEVGLPKIDYYAAQNDIIWAGGYKNPRMAFGPFNYILENHCSRHNLQMIEHIYYGKPQVKAFKFVEQKMSKLQPEGVFFMMGDNPRADIRGANNIGWYSFLTRTGIHTSEQNNEKDPATFVVQNFAQAIQVICTAMDKLSK